VVVRGFLDVRDGVTFVGWGFGSSEGAASGESTRDSPEAGIFHETHGSWWSNPSTL